MIYDKNENLRKYAAVYPGLGVIADFLETHDLASLPLGRIDLSDGVFLNMQEYEPYPAPDKWEAHRKYADLHIMVEGDERMDGAPISDAVGGNGYSEEYDFELFDSCADTFATVYGTPGVFVWFGTEDAHRPGLRLNTPKVKKAVFKIPV